ncbi:Phosphate-binding protein PstS [bacterium HR17]|uniref:Phosphate-binding protein PstS n=1 Tax=Candidatus Fervidibacter japonicus TaxID=2035412 RepID=A0A2H5XCB9_9BACT|nr:Phosphate-binding protein PstS [bacterium HR17]
MPRWWSVVAGAVALALPAIVQRGEPGASQTEQTVRISGAFALYPLTVRWAEEFRREGFKARFDITGGGAGKGITDALAGLVDIGMVSREPHPDELRKGAVFIPVAKDAVVAVVNARNPVRTLLLRKGVSREILRDIWVTQRIKTWGQVVGTKDNSPIHAYTRADAAGAAETWAQFLLGKTGKQEDLKGIAVSGDPGLADAVRRDPLGIGYNNINYAYNPRTGKPFGGLLVVPLDLNGDGKVGKAENFYATRQALLNAIADGRYPSPPARTLYFVTKGKPHGVVAEFIRWALTKGQRFASDAGYVPLSRAAVTVALRQLR